MQLTNHPKHLSFFWCFLSSLFNLQGTLRRLKLSSHRRTFILPSRAYFVNMLLSSSFVPLFLRLRAQSIYQNTLLLSTPFFPFLAPFFLRANAYDLMLKFSSVGGRLSLKILRYHFRAPCFFNCCVLNQIVIIFSLCYGAVPFIH